MRVFVTGATGFIGSAIVQELLAEGHTVLGLARSREAANRLRAAGATPHPGSIEDLTSLRTAAAQADGAIHTAFFHAFSHASLRTRLRVLTGGDPRKTVPRFLKTMIDTDRAVIDTLGDEFTASDRPLLATFGTMALTPGCLGSEADDVDPTAVGGQRGANEHAMRDLATRGVRTCAIRLPPIVHGDGDHGFLPQIISAARKHRISSYAGDGSNRWPSVHRLDAAHLFVQALNDGERGSRYHGVAETGVPFRDIATAIGEKLNLPAAPATERQIKARFGFVAPFIGVDNPTSSTTTQTALAWQPYRRTLLEDLTHGNYFNE